MAFKTVDDYNHDKYAGKFILQNDNDYADVVFLYKSTKEFLVADAHYIKSDAYNGYVHCCGAGCPACNRDIRKQEKLFIPLYNLTTGEVQFWDRTMRFEPQFRADVFSKYPNPSEVVFRVTRHGATGDRNTRYGIVAIARNTAKSMDKIMEENSMVFPDYYNQICRDVSPAIISDWLQSTGDNTANDMQPFEAVPRVATAPVSFPNGSTTPAYVPNNSVSSMDYSQIDEPFPDDVVF